MSYLYILEIKPLAVASFANIFSQSVGGLFMFLMVSFAVQKLISLIRPHLLIFVLFLLPWETHLRKHWYYLSENVLSVLSSRSFIVSCLMFKSLTILSVFYHFFDAFFDIYFPWIKVIF